MQTYSDPRRENDPHALPDVEIFYHAYDGSERTVWILEGTDEPMPAGWYWQTCFPGCLPDGDPIGPFATEAEALADAQGGE